MFHQKSGFKRFFSNKIEDSANGSDAIIVLTEWEEYKYIDWKMISEKMRSPSWVFDARSIANKKDIQNADMNFWSIGNGSIN